MKGTERNRKGQNRSRRGAKAQEIGGKLKGRQQTGAKISEEVLGGGNERAKDREGRKKKGAQREKGKLTMLKTRMGGELKSTLLAGVVMSMAYNGKRERSLFEPGPSQKQQTGLSQGKKGSKQKSRKAEKQNETRPMPTYIWKLYNGTTTESGYTPTRLDHSMIMDGSKPFPREDVDTALGKPRRYIVYFGLRRQGSIDLWPLAVS
ncbi:hypothetical protein PCH_Pc20g09130 [Penicillium rubens Wisconsin 54-1255]|uniref:Uncharacterized protein n=1 Tax=Penicillium rubens (strain ATCC 28089 / DSM 1075 / NRRL 1951 / Wisconsin 54-1255) TaxID=500485 RepID=B6HF16_PENRW|nr:hypothetical protein PCH_Pc20g09130 [Penicillium rubens Wisconsin 54-1255]